MAVFKILVFNWRRRKIAF